MGGVAAVATLGLAGKEAKRQVKKVMAPDIRVPQEPEAPAQTREVDTEARQAQRRQRQRATAARGRSSTILTGPLGITDTAQTIQKTLLGQ